MKFGESTYVASLRVLLVFFPGRMLVMMVMGFDVIMSIIISCINISLPFHSFGKVICFITYSTFFLVN